MALNYTKTAPEGMFQDLMVFSKQRTMKQAFGFYLFYLLLVALLGAVINMWYFSFFGNSGTTFSEGFNRGIELAQSYGLFINLLFCIIIGALVLSGKKLVKPKYILVVLFGVLISLIGGSLFGLFPISYLTMKKNGGE